MIILMIIMIIILLGAVHVRLQRAERVEPDRADPLLVIRREPSGGGMNGGDRFIDFHAAATTSFAGHRCTDTFFA